MLKISIGKILRGGIVTVCSSLIIFFLVITLSPALPFISLDGVMPLFLLSIIVILTVITYFLLPPELSDENKTGISNPLIQEDK